MEHSIDMTRRQTLLSDEQLGPYPLEKLPKVDKLTVDIYHETPKISERHMALAECLMGDWGEELAQKGADFTVRIPTGASIVNFQRYINAYPECPVAEEKAPLPEDPAVLTRHIKKFAYFMGADMVGVCEMPQDAMYTSKVDGTPITKSYKYAIVFLIRKHMPTVNASYGDEWIDDTVSMQCYQKLACVANPLADYIRRQGYPARASVFDNYVNVMPRLLALAGLGEFSRLGIVLNPFVGGAFKSAAVLTDLPLVPDKPVDFGLQKYCDECKICAEQCPAHAISAGEKIEFTGYQTWRTDVKRCFSHAVVNPHGCICERCIKTCPFNRPDMRPEDFANWDGDLKYIYDSVDAQRQRMEDLNYEDPSEKTDKWWLPQVYNREGKIVLGKDFDYALHERRMERIKAEREEGK